MNIYVASSWRNPIQPAIVELLRAEGHKVYDFRNPVPGGPGFGWPQVDPDWQSWTPAGFRDALDHPTAIAGFLSAFEAMMRADCIVLVMPCGRSAHLELGWGAGAGKRTAILLTEGEPELMYKLADALCTNVDDLLQWLRVWQVQWEESMSRAREGRGLP